MGWELRYFWKGQEMEATIQQALAELCVALGPIKERTDVYFSNGCDCGIKLRKKKEWEVKRCSARDGQLEQWTKVTFGRNEASMRRHLSQLSLPAPDLSKGIATTKRRQQAWYHRAQIEVTTIQAQSYQAVGEEDPSSHGTQSSSWVTVAVEADTTRAILETYAKLSEALSLEYAVFCGGYPGWLGIVHHEV
eukprot:m.41160 g.41160  ORF g.41160 m.41160 type:complete len:192 (+) comp12809_c0_seq5:856-1431(+)